ncbi:MAG: CPBP family intramembrane glutamic endopeptidase [Armatimonadota bacterium]
MRRLVFTLFWLESALAVAGFGLLAARIYFQRTTWQEVLHPTWQDTALGMLLAMLMLAMAVAGSAASERWAAWAFLKRWMLQVSPLFAEIHPREMILLSVVAGFGEEALFRGVIQSLSGIWLSSLLFAVVHVLRWDSDGIKMIAFYTPFGLLLGGLYIWSGNLWGCCIAHTLYDLIALWWIQRLLRR